MPHRPTHTNLPPNRKKWVFGFFLISAGLILLLHNLGLLPFNLPYYVFSWKILPFIFAIPSIAKGKWLPALFLLGLGTFLLGPQIFNLPVAEVHKFWPVLLILLGLGALNRKKKVCLPGSTSNEIDGYLNNSAVFGGISRKINTHHFKGGTLTAVFGGIELDLSECHMQPSDSPVVLEVNAIFGGISLRLPPGWNVKNEVTPVMGGFDDNKLSHSTDSELVSEIVFTGNVVFGGVEIKRS